VSLLQRANLGLKRRHASLISSSAFCHPGSSLYSSKRLFIALSFCRLGLIAPAPGGGRHETVTRTMHAPKVIEVLLTSRAHVAPFFQLRGVQGLVARFAERRIKAVDARPRAQFSARHDAHFIF
jgi:hypothetical protein